MRDSLLVQDELLSEAQPLPFQQLIAEDIVERVAAAVSDAHTDETAQRLNRLRNKLPLSLEGGSD